MDYDNHAGGLETTEEVVEPYTGPLVTFQQVVVGVYGATTDVVPYPAGFLKRFQRYWAQNCIYVPDAQLEEVGYAQVGEDSSNGTSPKFTVKGDLLTQCIEAFLDTRPPLCPILDGIAEAQGGAGLGSRAAGSSSAANVGTTSGAASKGADDNDTPVGMAIRKAKIALRDIGIGYDELCKRSLKANTDMLIKSGLSVEASTRIAGGIYKRKREATDNEVEQLTPRTSAVNALERDDRVVSLRNCRLCPDDVNKYLSVIKGKQFLTTLDISGNNIHHKGAPALASTLASLPSLVSLSVPGNNLQFEGLKLVCKALKNRNNFAFLDISSNNGGPQTGAALGADLRIRALSVAGNHITGEGIMALAPAARTAHRLILSSNSFGVGNKNPSSLDDMTQAKTLSTLINACEHVSHLDISNNNFSSEASAFILESCIATHPAIVSMDLSLNNFEVGHVAEVVVANPQMTEVRLFSNVSVAKATVAGGEHEKLAKPVVDAVNDNKRKMLEFRAFLTQLTLPQWTSENVRDALTFLMRRRDIAVQAPVNGSLLMTLRELPDSDGSNCEGVCKAEMPASLASLGMTSDYEALCNFLDGFRENNGDIVVIHQG